MLLATCIGLCFVFFYPFIIVAILLEDGGPIFFTQNRIGQNNKILKRINFRSMTKHSEGDGLARDAQVTRIGNFLRKTRLDELPQV